MCEDRLGKPDVGQEREPFRPTRTDSRLHIERLLDEALMESFPASDPPSIAMDFKEERKQP
jgi:hypothetical protein